MSDQSPHQSTIDGAALRKAERALARALEAVGVPNATGDDWTAEARTVIQAWCVEVDGRGDDATRAGAVERMADA